MMLKNFFDRVEQLKSKKKQERRFLFQQFDIFLLV